MAISTIDRRSAINEMMGRYGHHLLPALKKIDKNIHGLIEDGRFNEFNNYESYVSCLEALILLCEKIASHLDECPECQQ